MSLFFLKHCTISLSDLLVGFVIEGFNNITPKLLGVLLCTDNITISEFDVFKKVKKNSKNQKNTFKQSCEKSIYFIKRIVNKDL